MPVDQGTAAHPIADRQAELRPIWGGFAGLNTPTRTAAPSSTRNTGAEPPLAEAVRPTPHEPRRGTFEPHQRAEHAQPGTIHLQLNSRAAATFVGFLAVAAFVLIVFLGSTTGLTPGPAAASATPHLGPTPTDRVTWSGVQAETAVTLGEYSEQVAIATLTSGLHEVNTHSVTFFADPNRSGNALQQFGAVFGEAIATGRNPVHVAPRAEASR